MIKTLHIFFLLIFISTTFSQNDDQIVWSSKKLRWQDFAGEIPSESKFHALTHSLIDLQYQADGHSLTFEIKTVFEKTKSWKKEEADTYLLQHEQIHFDITEYYSRLMRKKIKHHRFKSTETITKEVKSIFNEIYAEANEMQLLYDKETAHSINRKKQKKWNKKLAKYLKKLNNYRNPKIKVDISYLLN